MKQKGWGAQRKEWWDKATTAYRHYCKAEGIDPLDVNREEFIRMSQIPVSVETFRKLRLFVSANP